MTLTAGSLFSGIGGIDLAFALAGFDIRYQVEINPFCRKVLRKHARHYWRNAVQYADVQQCGTGRAHPLEYVTALVGGFPCQSISNAGKREGIAEGTKSGLWYDFRRIIGDVRPRVVLLENVAAITSRDGVKVIADLTALGYDARWGIISAADAGATHLRERWWCVGYANVDRQAEISTRGGQPDYHQNRHNPTAEQSRVIELAESISTCEVGNPNNGRCEERYVSTSSRAVGQFAGGFDATRRRCTPRRRISESGMGRNADGLSRRMDGDELTRHIFPAPPGKQLDHEPPRTTRERFEEALAAYGNAVVPQVVYPIAKLLAEVLS